MDAERAEGPGVLTPKHRERAVNRPRPGCLSCEATPQTLEPKAPTAPELLLVGERIDRR